MVGFSDVAVEVDDVEEALDIYGRIFEVEPRGRGPGMAFVASETSLPSSLKAGKDRPTINRHVGFVVNDKRAVRRALREAGVEVRPGRSLDFLCPWGDRRQVIEYGEIQFTEAPEVLRRMGLGDLKKAEKALKELRRKGLSPE